MTNPNTTNTPNASKLMQILMAKHQPEKYAKEQEEADKRHKEHLAFIEGYKSSLQAVEKSKDSPLFISDLDSPCGFKPNK